MLDPDLGPLNLPAGDVVCNLLQNRPSVFIRLENSKPFNTWVTVLKHPYANNAGFRLDT